MNYLKKNLINILLMAFLLFLPVISLAQNNGIVPVKGDNSNNGIVPVDKNGNRIYNNNNDNNNDNNNNYNNNDNNDKGSFSIENPIEAKTFSELIQKILKGIVKIGMPFLVLAIIYCGFLFVQAQGNTEEIGHAKRALNYTLIGAAILLGSWAIAQLIVDTVKAL